jgi:hypothetical protein
MPPSIVSIAERHFRRPCSGSPGCGRARYTLLCK